MNLNENFRYLQFGLPDDILRRKTCGDFDGAIRLIDRKLEDEETPEFLRRSLTAQREIIRRLPLDYPLTKREAVELVRRHIPDFTEAEFERFVSEGRIGWIYIHGEPHYFNRFYASLCKTDAEFARRASNNPESPAPDEQSGNALQDATIQKMRTQGGLSLRFRCRESLRLKESVYRPGMKIRAYLPVPCACATQSEIHIERISPEPVKISPETAPQRVVFWEEAMEENHPFTVEFSYDQNCPYVDLEKRKPDAVQPAFYMEEQPPQILFTPYIRALVRELSANTENPLETARHFYDFITTNVKYSFMRAYFGLENIAENCARNLVGDCGVQALLFITLCRCAGIPARFQGGWRAEPCFCGAHDWAQFYIAPFGWLFADPSFGGAAFRNGSEDRRKYYFGNLDPYRMVSNTEFEAAFDVPKDQWRADPYDNQSGEMETETRGLLSGEYDSVKKVLECRERK